MNMRYLTKTRGHTLLAAAFMATTMVLALPQAEAAPTPSQTVQSQDLHKVRDRHGNDGRRHERHGRHERDGRYERHGKHGRHWAPPPPARYKPHGRHGRWMPGYWRGHGRHRYWVPGYWATWRPDRHSPRRPWRDNRPHGSITIEGYWR